MDVANATTTTYSFSDLQELVEAPIEDDIQLCD